MKPKIELYLLLFLLISLSYGQDIQNFIVEPLRIENKLVLTGNLQNEFWELAKPISLEYEINPGDNIPAPQKTLVRVLYNDDYIYFGFECFDSNPNQIRANISERDNIFEDDYVILAIDTFGDKQKAFEFATNPYGIQADLLMNASTLEEDLNFNTIWESKAKITKNGWEAEIAIPFKSLNFKSIPIQNWNFLVMRSIPRNSRHQISWTKVDKNIPGLLQQAGILKGLKDIKTSASFEYLPYVMGQVSGRLHNSELNNSNFLYDPFKGRIGGSVKYSPNSNITISAVINPDFSQIESDAAQIDVNTTFALFYDEKRPFFLEGREQLSGFVYYSRSINNPSYASKIVGKSDNLTYIYLNAYDRNTVIVVPGTEESNTVRTNKSSFSNIAKIQYNFSGENYFGGTALTRNFDEGSNYVFGLDWMYRFWQNWDLSGEIYFSSIKELNIPANEDLINVTRTFGNTSHSASFDGESYSGTGLNISLNHSQKHYKLNLTYTNIDPTFQSYNGLINKSGFQAIDIINNYWFYFENSFLEKLKLHLNLWQEYNSYGKSIDRSVIVGIGMNLKAQSYLELKHFIINDEFFRDIEFKKQNRWIFSFNTKPLKFLTLYLNGNAGKYIFRSVNPLEGNGYNLYAGLKIKISNDTKIDLSYNKAELSESKSKSLLYNGYTLRSIITYQFSEKMFIRAIGDYNSFSKSFHIYPLLSYKVNAFTSLYVGATSNYDKSYISENYLNTSQEFFIKFQYLLGI